MPYNVKAEEKCSCWYDYHVRIIKLIYIKGDYLFISVHYQAIYILVAMMNLGIFLISFTYSPDIYSELIMDQKILGTWNIVLKKVKSLTSHSHYVISGIHRYVIYGKHIYVIYGKHRNVTRHIVMGAFQKIKASKRGLRVRVRLVIPFCLEQSKKNHCSLGAEE